MRKRHSTLTLAILCIALLLTACEAVSPKTRKVIPEWSRGLQLGVAAVNQPVHIVSSQGKAHVLWVTAGNRSLSYVRLGESGQVESHAELAIGGAHPSDTHLLVRSDGTCAALWTDNPNMPRALFLAQFAADGALLSGPTRLTPDGARVADIAAVSGPDHSYELFWADESPAEGGLHHIRLSGQSPGQDQLLVAGAMSPVAQADQNGRIHLTWTVEPSLRENYVYYALFDPATQSLISPTRVAMYRTATGLVSYPPRLGLDSTRVYLFWSLEQRGGGNSPGEAHTYYVSFPIDQPQAVEPVMLDIPDLARPVYAAATGELPYNRLASATVGSPTSLLYMPSTSSGQNAELGVFLVAQVSTRHRTTREVVWAVFRDGMLQGYQLPSSTGSAMRPEASLDSNGNVHLVWLSTGGFGRYEVYYASTAPKIRSALDRITLQDLAADLLNAMWNLAPAIGFFPPVFLLWTFVSFVWVILYYFVRVEGGMERRGSQIALGIAILLYLFSKLFLMPGVLFYAPFINRFPEHLQIVPVLGTPLLTLAAAIAALWLYARKREFKSLFAMYMIFVLTDALLSLIIYVPGWLGG